MNNEEFYEYVKVALTTRLLALRGLSLEIIQYSWPIRTDLIKGIQ